MTGAHEEEPFVVLPNGDAELKGIYEMVLSLQARGYIVMVSESCDVLIVPPAVNNDVFEVLDASWEQVLAVLAAQADGYTLN